MMRQGATSTTETSRLPRGVWLLVPFLGPFFLVYPVSVVLAADPPTWRIITAVGGAALFAAVFLWLMWWHQPLQLITAKPSEVFKYRATIAFLAVLAGALSFALGPEWRMLFFFHINIAAGIMLPRKDATIIIPAIAIFTFVAGLSTGLAFLAVPAAIIGIWSTTFVRQVATVAELRAAREELARLAVSEERLRFARDLHDLLGHSLSLITLKSELAERLLPDIPRNAEARNEVQDLQSIARGALREVREAVSGYRKPSLDDELAGACTMLEAAGITCRPHKDFDALPGQTESILTWVVREGVTNVVRHSGATRCEIKLTCEGQDVYVTVRDNGRNPHQPLGGDGIGGTGLSGLAERVASHGGHLRAGRLPGEGFELSVYIPVDDGSCPEIGRPLLAESRNGSVAEAGG